MRLRGILVLTMALLFSSLCWGWDCTQKGQIRVQVPNGTVGNGTGDGPGQVVTVEGLTFECENPPTNTSVPKTSNTFTNTNTNSNSNNNSNQNSNTNNNTSTSTSTASSNQNQSQKQQQSQSQTATGGNASSTSSATGGNSAATATSNGDNSNNTTINEAKIPVNTAVTPPILPTAPCTKGMGGAGQGAVIGGSFGISRIDQGCDDRELARAFEGPQTVASCKILIGTKKAKKAGVTMQDCLRPQVPQIIIQAPVTPVTPAAAPVTVTLNVQPAPVTILPAPPQYRTEITVHAPRPVVKKPIVHHMPPNCQNVIERVCKNPDSSEIGKRDAGTKG